jgi:hypothetical protein
MSTSWEPSPPTLVDLVWAEVIDRLRPRPSEYPASYLTSPLDIADDVGIVLDDWQKRGLLATERRRIFLVSRQGGKGIVAAIDALVEMIAFPGSKVVILTPTEEQSKRLMARVRETFARLSVAPRIVTDTSLELSLLNGSRCLGMPGSEVSVRGIDAVHKLIVDEAGFVPDPLYAAVRPFLATTNGRESDYSTPKGKRGWFYRAVMQATGLHKPKHFYFDKVTGPEIPRIHPDFLANELAEMGQYYYDQEYLCEFLDDQSQAFPTELILATKSPDVIVREFARLGA